MNNEYTDIQTEKDTSYWTSVLLIGTIFGLVSFAINLIFQYMQIGSEPTGSIVTPVMLGGVIVCLATAMAGLAAVWHYTKDVSPYLTLGKGALIGFLTGTVIVVITVVLNELWLLFDPELNQKMIDSIVANMDAMDIPEEAKQQTIDATVAQYEDQSLLMNLVFQIPFSGLLNLLTALLGVKFFAIRDEAQ